MINAVRKVVLWGKKVAEDAGLTFLYKDEFITNEAAPMVDPRTCEPGPGVLDLTDSAATQLSISGSILQVGYTAANDPRASTNAQVVNQPGRCLPVCFLVSVSNSIVL